MDSHELALLSAHILKSLAGRDVALLVRADNGEPAGWARTGPGGAARGESCCVEAFRAKAEAGFPPADLLVYTTVKPTVMCLGMGIRAHARAFVFIDGGRISFLTCDDLGLAPTVATNANLPPVALPWLGAFAGTAAGIRAAKGSIAEAVRDGEIDTLKIYYNELTRSVAGGGQWLHMAAEQRLAPPAPPRFRMPDLQTDCGAPATPIRHRLYMLLTSALLHLVRQQGVPQLDGKNVSCVLVGPTGRILSWAVNNNTGNTTRHAETNCLLSFLAQSPGAVPGGSFLYTSLESCEMCAGMLVTVAPGITVVFATRDPGIQDTALKRQINQATQRPYGGPSGNPIARANFQRLVHKVVLRERERSMRPLADQALQAVYDPKHPRPDAQAYPADQRRDVMQRHAQARRQAETTLNRLYTRVRLEPLLAITRTLPQSITTALDRPEVAAAFGAYTREFFEYANAMISVAGGEDGDGTIVARHPELAAVAIPDIRALANCLLTIATALGGALAE